MNTAWIFSDQLVLDPTIDLNTIKNIGSTWGGWKTWRACQTDNVICHDLSKSQELIKKQFNQRCNFFISNENYQILARPDRVNIYEGKFKHIVDGQDEIVAMHLCAAQNDVILLLGFDFSEPIKLQDKLLEHRAHNYRSLVKQVIKAHSQVQWVLIDHEHAIMKDYADLINLTKDTFGSVETLLGNQ